MANVIILGGGFGGVVAAEQLARTLDPQHHVTLISRDDAFIFYPALVRYAFGECERRDISFDLREAMLSRRVHFIKAEVARINPIARRVTLAHGDVQGDVSYDYLVFALGRRLATERVHGFYDHAHHILSAKAALKFREAVDNFHEGSAVIGSCPGARLPIPVYETAFALSRRLKEKGTQERVRITLVDPEMTDGGGLGGREMAEKLYSLLRKHDIELVTDFPVSRVTSTEVLSADGGSLPHDLLMLIPPFTGAGAGMHAGITNSNNFIRVDKYMRVPGVERLYAVGDAVDLPGAKLGHIAVRQAEVAAANLSAELAGLAPTAEYEHELRTVIDAGGGDALYLRRSHGEDEGTLRQGIFWRWAKRAHETYWRYEHA